MENQVSTLYIYPTTSNLFYQKLYTIRHEKFDKLERVKTNLTYFTSIYKAIKNIFGNAMEANSI